MPEINILLGGLKTKIEYNYDYMAHFCKDYLSRFDTPDIIVKSDTNDILKEKQLVPRASVQSCESLCIYRAIAEQLPRFDRVVFHGAAIKYDGNAYLFTAPSGTGKTTHINLWRDYLGQKVEIINGDKPIIHVGDVATVYGTPWAGKEGFQKNTSAPIHAICILKQALANKIVQLSKSEAVGHLMRQVYMPQNPAALSQTLSLLGKMIETIPVYVLECDISEQAFKTSFNEITK